jgi:hypothetical protein
MGDSMSTIINATTTNGVVIQPDNSGSLVLQTNNGTTALTIDTSQNVGIGTTSPAEKLNVVGSSTNAVGMRVDNTQSSTVGTLYNTSTTYSYSGIGASTTWFYGNKTVAVGTDSANPVQFICNNAERMRIDTSGNVLLGASSLPFSNSNFSNGSIYTNNNIFVNNSAGTANYNVRLDGFADQVYFVWSNGNTQTNAISYAYGGTAWVNSSDETLKNIIEPITNAVDKVSQLRSVIGKFKTEEEGIRHPFLIAQDVQKVLPEAVYVNKSRIKGEPDTLGIGYTDIIPLLVAAIKEQQIIINDLKARVETLEAK